MRDLPWAEAFDGAFCFGGSFGYFDDPCNLSFLKSVSKTLKPGARFLLDTNYSAERFFSTFRERKRNWVQYDDATYLLVERPHYDPIHSRVETERIYIKEASVEKMRSSVRLYTYREHCQMLEAAGFTSCQGYGSLNLDPFEVGSERLILFGVKR